MTDPTLIERIQKLLAKTTEAGCTAAEAETAFAFAARIMARHNIDMATVESHRGEQETYGEEVAAQVARGSSLTESAMTVVKRFFFVEGYTQRGIIGGRRITRYVLFGSPQNLAAASHVFRQFVAAGEFAWLEFKAARTRSHGRPPARKAKYDFCEGFFVGVMRKLRAERAELVADEPETSGMSNGNAIVLVESRTRQAFEAAYPKMRSVAVRGRSPGDAAAFRSGVDAGSAFNPARPIGGGRRAIGNG